MKVEPATLADIRLERGIVRDRICIRPQTRDLLAVMPGEYACELQLKVWVTRRADANQLGRIVKRKQQAGQAEHV